MDIILTFVLMFLLTFLLTLLISLISSIKKWRLARRLKRLIKALDEEQLPDIRKYFEQIFGVKALSTEIEIAYDIANAMCDSHIDINIETRFRLFNAARNLLINEDEDVDMKYVLYWSDKIKIRNGKVYLEERRKKFL